MVTPIVRDRQLVVRRTLRAAGADLDRLHRHGSSAAIAVKTGRTVADVDVAAVQAELKRQEVRLW